MPEPCAPRTSTQLLDPQVLDQRLEQHVGQAQLVGQREAAQLAGVQRLHDQLLQLLVRQARVFDRRPAPAARARGDVARQLMVAAVSGVTSLVQVVVSSVLLDVLGEREEHLHELDRGRPDGHDPDRREDAEHQREHHLHAGLRGRFLRPLPALRPQRLRVHAQRLRHAGAELIGLNEHRRQRHHVFEPGPIAQVAQRLGARLAGAQLDVHQLELVGQVGIGEGELVARRA